MLEALLTALVREDVRFVVVGGVAMRLHGSAAFTQGLDVFYSRDRDNLVSLVRALRDLEPRLRDAPRDLPFPWELRTLEAGLNFALDTEAGPLELLGELSGVDSFRDLSSRAVHLRLRDVYVPVASLPDLIVMKTAAGRPKDHAHLRELEALRALLEEEVAEPS